MSRVTLQSPLLQAALRRPTQLLPRCTPTSTTTINPTTARYVSPPAQSGTKSPNLTSPPFHSTFSHLPTLRPTLTAPSPLFRAPNKTLQQLQPLQLQQTPAGTETLDVIAKSSISAHPALAGCASQIRCGPRPTMSGATRLVQKRRHGFLSRIRTREGRNMLKRKRAKGRKKLGA